MRDMMPLKALKTRSKRLESRTYLGYRQVALSEVWKQKKISKRISFLSERGDSNARPLRPERSALPTALLSVLRCKGISLFSILQINKRKK